jgi:tRNA threonylcarbamoyladenosine biosynthesis protein TsaE
MRFASKSEAETRELGYQLAQRLPDTGVVLLTGDLGAGKTTLAKGIVEGLGAAAGDEVTSPTYTIIHEYGDPVRVYHIDLYRLDTPEEVIGLGFEETKAVLLIEWGERFPTLMPEKRVSITLTAADDDTREITVEGHAELKSSIGDATFLK